MWLAFVQHLCLVLPLILNSLAFVREGLCRGCFGGGGSGPRPTGPDPFPSSPPAQTASKHPGFFWWETIRFVPPRHSGINTPSPQRFGSCRSKWLTLRNPVGFPDPGEVRAGTWEPPRSPSSWSPTPHPKQVLSLCLWAAHQLWARHPQWGCAASAPLHTAAAKSRSTGKPRLTPPGLHLIWGGTR